MQGRGLPALVFAGQNLIHLLRRFLAAALQPLLDNGVQARLEKRHMIGDVLVVKVLLGLPCMIELGGAPAVIAQLEIGLIKKRIVLDVVKQAQGIVAVDAVGPILLIKLRHLRFQLFSKGVRKRIKIRIVGVKGAALELCLFYDFGYRDGRVSKGRGYGRRHVYQDRGQICGPVFDPGRGNRSAGKAKAQGKGQAKINETAAGTFTPAAVFVMAGTAPWP